MYSSAAPSPMPWLRSILNVSRASSALFALRRADGCCVTCALIPWRLQAVLSSWLGAQVLPILQQTQLAG